MNKHNRFNCFTDNDYKNIEINKKWKHITLDKDKTEDFSSFSKKKKQLVPNEKENKKTLLCYNMLVQKSCNYGCTCKYAHSLDEQIIEKSRKAVHDILTSDTDLSHINFQENVNLYRGLLLMTKICDKENCPGGYNCRNGACKNTNLCVCEQDLNYGNCKNKECKYIHLTKRNLRPFWITTNETKKINNIVHVKGILLSNDFWKTQSDHEDYEDYEDNDTCSELSLSSKSTDNSSCSSNEYEESIFS